MNDGVATKYGLGIENTLWANTVVASGLYDKIITLCIISVSHREGALWASDEDDELVSPKGVNMEGIVSFKSWPGYDVVSLGKNLDLNCLSPHRCIIRVQ